MMYGSAKDTVEEEDLRRLDSSFIYLNRKALDPLLTLRVKELGHLSGDTVFLYQ